jgi:hypothetical protein
LDGGLAVGFFLVAAFFGVGVFGGIVSDCGSNFAIVNSAEGKTRGRCL